MGGSGGGPGGGAAGAASDMTSQTGHYGGGGAGGTFRLSNYIVSAGNGGDGYITFEYCDVA